MSKPGAGTTFSFTLPLADPDDSPVDDTPEVLGFGLQLVMDEDE